MHLKNLFLIFLLLVFYFTTAQARKANRRVPDEAQQISAAEPLRKNPFVTIILIIFSKHFPI
jgi:hypothetical protein